MQHNVWQVAIAQFYCTELIRSSPEHFPKVHGGHHWRSGDTIMTRQLVITRTAISVLALGALSSHLFVPQLKLDPVALGLLVVAVVPWLSSVVKSLEVPGAGKIEFQEVREATERATGDKTKVPPAPIETEFSFLAVSELDPNLALVGLRVELEKRLRKLAKANDLPASRPLPQLTNELQQAGVLSAEQAAGLRDLIALGNGAAHGLDVSASAGRVAVEFGPDVLRVLDAKLSQHQLN
jgi:hypothetical protein